MGSSTHMRTIVLEYFATEKAQTRPSIVGKDSIHLGKSCQPQPTTETHRWLGKSSPVNYSRLVNYSNLPRYIYGAYGLWSCDNGQLSSNAPAGIQSAKPRARAGTTGPKHRQQTLTGDDLPYLHTYSIHYCAYVYIYIYIYIYIFINH